MWRDLQPAGREDGGDLQQRLQLVERLLRLIDENIDPHELVLEVGAEVRILRHRSESDATLALPDRVRFSTEVREGDAHLHVTFCIAGCRPKLILEGLFRLLGMGTRVCGIAHQGVTLSEAKAPDAPLIIKRARFLAGVRKPPGPIVITYQIDRIKRSPADPEQE